MAKPRGAGSAGVLMRCRVPRCGNPVAGITLTGWLLSRVRVQRVLDAPVRGLLPVQPEAWLVGGPVDDEAQRGRLPAEARVVCHDPDVVVGVGGPAGGDLVQARRGVGDVEHRQPPHLPQHVARMRVVGELDRHRPALVNGVLDLGADLVVGEVGQVGERALGDPHEGSSQDVGVAITSGVSVDS